MTTTLYVEGGGDTKLLRSACRRGFQKFIEKAGLAGNMPKIVAQGSRNKAFDSFCRSLAGGDNGAMLLVDAEGPVTADSTWHHLNGSDGWSRPSAAPDTQCHLMVQVMESWFIADKDALQSFYGQGFRSQALPQNPDIEDVAKQDVFSRLEQAISHTKKGGYKKGTDSFEILGKLDPDKVRKASPHADRFIRAL